MRKHLFSLSLVAVLGSSFALAQSSPAQQPQQNLSQPNQSQTSDQAAALKTQVDIETALAKEGTSATSNVNVQVTSSAVELTGTVLSEADKNRVEQIATAHAGGLPVKNNVKVETSSPQ